MKPLIGINVDLTNGPPPNASVQYTYIESVVRSGGIPILIPPVAKQDLQIILASLDGLLMTGGLDYSAGLTSAPGPTVELTDPRREEFDLRLVKEAIDLRRLPLLLICAGMQAANIALGGTLIEDLKTNQPESQVNHCSGNGWVNGWTRHSVDIENGSRLAEIFPARRIDVVANHHQAIDRLADGLTVVGYADDGVIEAVEIKNHPFAVGVQWHPERDYDQSLPLFDAFIQAAQANKLGNKLVAKS